MSPSVRPTNSVPDWSCCDPTIRFESCRRYSGISKWGAGTKIFRVNKRWCRSVLRNTSRTDFKFYADRLIRLVIEESLNQLPFDNCKVITPTGNYYIGTKYQRGNCGVSIVRSGEAMEQVNASLAPLLLDRWVDQLLLKLNVSRVYGIVVDQFALVKYWSSPIRRRTKLVWCMQNFLTMLLTEKFY